MNEPEQIAALVEEIRSILAGRSPPLQSAALCDLMAIWLAGHRGPDRDTTDKIRAQLLRDWLYLLAKLILVNEAEIDRRFGDGSQTAGLG